MADLHTKLQTMIYIKTFGILAEKIGSQDLQVDQITDTDSLRAYLTDKYPELSTLKFTIAVDKKQVKENKELHQNSEVALLPPFSGG